MSRQQNDDSAEAASVVRAEPFAVSIEEAYKIVGLSRRPFYELFIDTGRIKTLPVGTRRLVILSELRAACDRWAAEIRANLPA